MHNTSSHPSITARALSKSFAGASGVRVDAVKSVDLEIREGEFVVIGGPNGGGKTTLLTLLGCMSRPSSGSLLINRTDVMHLSHQEQAKFRMRTIGFVFQTFRLVDCLTAKENVELVAHVGGISATDAATKSAELLNEVGVAHRAGFYPRQLSGGEKQRVAIARAMITNPRVILADEPTGSLDSAAGQMIIRLLRSSSKERKTTVLVVSHDERIYSHADRVLRMEDGTLSTMK